MNLDFLSIDPGSIFFTLINTLILFLVIKHFLFKPVNKMLEERKDDIALTYSKADNALEKAKQYYYKMDMSKKAIYDQLTSSYGEQFTSSQAQYAIDHLE